MNKLILLSSVLFILPLRSYAELSFDVSALENTANTLNESMRKSLAELNGQVPGNYLVRVEVNGEIFGSSLIGFYRCGEKIYPVLSLEKLKEWGVNSAALSGFDATNVTGTIKKPLSSVIEGADAQLSSDSSRLIVSIPQKFMTSNSASSRLARVEQSGIPALFVSYYYNGQRTESQSDSVSESHFLNLNNGLNVGPWRFRQNAYAVQNGSGKINWRSDQTYVGRDLLSIMSRVVLGQTSTSGRVFDSFSFRGVTLASVDDMLPDSQRNYSPVISGLALTQATVEVRQNGNLLYQKTVPPGPFALNDVVPNNTSGDLIVTIRESSGELRTFVQPYATQPKMVRKDQLRYSLSAGRYENSGQAADNNIFTQLEALYGLSNRYTVFGGTLTSDTYQSVAAGAGINMGDLGGLSAEFDSSRKHDAEGEKSIRGSAAKFSYEKSFETTSTTFSTTLTNSFNPEYATYNDYQVSKFSSSRYPGRQTGVRQSWQLSLSQNLRDLGSLSLNYYSQQFWDSRYRTATLNASYNTVIKGVSTSITYSKSDITNVARYKDQVISFNISVPFSLLWGSPGQARLNQSYVQSSRSPGQNQTVLSGSILDDSNLNYSLTKTWTGQQAGSAAQIQYGGGYGTVNAAWSQNTNGDTQYSAGASGSVVMHPEGVTFGQNISQNDAFAIVSAPGADGVSLMTRSGIKTDWRGYAVVPSLTPYRNNTVGLDASTVGDDVSLQSTQRDVMPGFGTAVSAKFGTSVGSKAYLKILNRNRSMPLGTEITGDKGSSGIIDEKGSAWLTGLNDGEVLTVHAADLSCTAGINLSALSLRNDIYIGTIICR